MEFRSGVDETDRTDARKEDGSTLHRPGRVAPRQPQQFRQPFTPGKGK